MKRLTTRLSNSVASWNYSDDCYGEDETKNKVFRSVHRQNACEKLAAIEDILGDDYDLDRLRELAEAERDGRCVVLPCKVGDVVYEIRYTAENIRPGKHSRKKFDHSVSGCTWRMRARPDMCYVSAKKCTKSDFSFMGRTVFLTRAEAEDALKAREQDG